MKLLTKNILFSLIIEYICDINVTFLKELKLHTSHPVLVSISFLSIECLNKYASK